MKEKQKELLIQKACQVREKAHAPYSQFKVGAVLEGKSGNLYMGVNVESSSYGLSVCAERNAIARAVSEGETSFKRIVVASHGGVSPCGACRQVLWDICGDIEVIMVDETGKVVRQMKTSDLFPVAFDKEKLAHE
ncbi:MAG: cytidine deaminase [Candidatus Marinimicrobia bacterium]|jgi:cytidine deaminase|nr:cytidine deaminase [Candidatus Neomarinimicrobiota bacterium]